MPAAAEKEGCCPLKHKHTRQPSHTPAQLHPLGSILLPGFSPVPSSKHPTTLVLTNEHSTSQEQCVGDQGREEHRLGKQTQFYDPGQVTSPRVSFPPVTWNVVTQEEVTMTL